MDDKVIGETLKKIRKGKKLTVKYITSNIISPQHYYKVEKGETYLSCNYLLQILSRMNVSYKEFSILIDSDNSQKKKCLILGI
ncbi:helix-turn-helix domain-containing protein [Enterococcus spodopteracolus]|uniref:helix-turn-helix domain-containing protein n=1 Tax=Enterococcus spodopteracolus TaxID=3034501 RepID=UPI0026477906|nr:helix-turn-helix transcriptional regulator [Enterococcus spodopteracolus]